VRKAVIIMSILSIVLLITTGALGMALRHGAEGIRQIHFHVAMSSATTSIITHVLALIFVIKNKDAKSPAAAS